MHNLDAAGVAGDDAADADAGVSVVVLVVLTHCRGYGVNCGIDSIGDNYCKGMMVLVSSLLYCPGSHHYQWPYYHDLNGNYNYS